MKLLLPILIVLACLGRNATAQTAAPVDPDAIVAETNPDLLNREINAYADSLKNSDLPGAVRHVESAQGPGRPQLLAVLIARWGQFDWKGALAESQKPGDREATQAMINSIFSYLAGHDIDEAVRQAVAMPLGGVIINRGDDDMPPPDPLHRYPQQTPGEKRLTAMRAVVATVAQHDPARALELALGWQKIGRYEGTWNGLAIVFEPWAAQDPDQAAQALLKLPPMEQMEPMTCLVHARVLKDPLAAIAWADKLPPNLSESAHSEAVSFWARSDPKAVFLWTQKQPDSSIKTGELQMITTEWSTLDPKAEVEFIDTLPVTDYNKDWLRAAVQTWGVGDPISAVPRIEKLPDVKERNAILNQIFDAWLAADSKAAMAWFDTLSGPDKVNGWYVITGWVATQDPAVAVKILDKIPQSQQKDNATLNLIWNWAQSDPTAAWDWTQKLPDSKLKIDLSGQVLQHMEKDPKMLQDHLDSLPEGEYKNGILSGIIPNLAASNLPLALKLTEKIEDGPKREEVVASMSYAWSQTDPAGEVAYFARLPEGETRRRSLETAINAWAGKDPAALVAWFKGAPSELRDETLSCVQGIWASVDLKGLTDYVLAMPPGDARAEKLAYIGRDMMMSDPAKANAWFESLAAENKPDRIRTSAVEAWAATSPQMDTAVATAQVALIKNPQWRIQAADSVAYQWGQHDGAAAMKWLDTQQTETERSDKVIVSDIVDFWTRNDPEGAYHWTTRLADAGRRHELESRVLEYWMRKDRVAALPVVEKSDLSDEAKSTLRNTPEGDL